MSGVQVELQPAHAYTLLLVVLLQFVHLWAGIKVGQARKLYGVEYPEMYADKGDKNAKAFNCVQRGHQNILENIPIFLGLLFTSSIYRPQVAAIAGFVRIVAFVLYMRGYATGDPKKRIQGAFGHLAQLVNLGLTVEASLRILGFLG